MELNFTLSIELIILTFAWIIPAILLIIFINKKNFLNAQVSFLFMQVPSFLFGALVVQGGFIEYPVGFLKVAYNASFTFEFFVYPAISIFFNIYFPKDKLWFIKAIYILAFPTLITIIEVYLEKHTQLIKYLNWSWYWSFITLTLVLLLSYWYYQWFFEKIKQHYKNN